MTPLKAIRIHCLKCMGWTGKGSLPYKTVKKCPNMSCEFYSYRMGKNPKRKGIGGNPEIKTDYIMNVLR